ncbi:zinc ribbon domain-containing protein [Paenibacillus aceti]|uniref:Uncharacterized protein n=1 Tax=Paenibacillus aceti TaxID=1820010 RepID=A0ABQ1W015_9BACL|nr:zinc ribbon domain-containing protein [Paenibacillus aceti]GGG06948.1 hypothetical protein GCM10010913_30990 [Paenibacillus aceti]
MQQFIRTINTSDAFKIKMEQLEKDLKLKTEPMKAKLKSLEKEYEQCKAVALGTEVGGGLLGFFGSLARVVGTLIFFFSVITGLVDEEALNHFLAAVVGVAILGIVVFLFGLKWKSKAKAMLRQARQRQQEAEVRKNALKEEIDALRDEIIREHKHYEALIDETKSNYEQHMLNQQELITSEVESLKQYNNSGNDTKECPQCAEIVKARAKICRFCNYKFEESA